MAVLVKLLATLARWVDAKKVGDWDQDQKSVRKRDRRQAEEIVPQAMGTGVYRDGDERVGGRRFEEAGWVLQLVGRVGRSREKFQADYAAVVG